jgi:hypothetical protein
MGSGGMAPPFLASAMSEGNYKTTVHKKRETWRGDHKHIYTFCVKKTWQQRILVILYFSTNVRGK